MKVSVVSDEVSSDLETALEVIASWGVKFVEIRGIGDQRFPEVTDYWHYRLPQLVQEFGLSVAAISPGLFRTIPPGHTRPPMGFTRGGDMSRVHQQLEAERLRDHHIEQLLPTSIEAAQRLGARTIICFSFGRLDHTEDELVADEVIQVMRHAAEKVAAAGLTLNIEVAEATRRSVNIVRRVNHPALGINWDPANAFNGGEDCVFPDGFELGPALHPSCAFQRRAPRSRYGRPPLDAGRRCHGLAADARRPQAGWLRRLHHRRDPRPTQGPGHAAHPGASARPYWGGRRRGMKVSVVTDEGLDGWISLETQRRAKVDSTHCMLRRRQTMVAATQSASVKWWRARQDDTDPNCVPSRPSG